MDDKILEALKNFFDALRSLLDFLISHFGPWGTIVIVFVLLLLLLGMKIYNDWHEDRAIRRALDEKEKSIQRLANQERTWRRLFLTKGIKLSEQEANRLLLLEGDYADPAQSRKAVERRRRKK